MKIMDSGKRRRVLGVALALTVVAAVFAYLALSSVGDNLVYYWSPSELRAEGADAVGATVRLGGLVEVGSLQRATDGLSLRFTVTDGKQSVPVSAHTVPPAMFREGIGVVIEGRMGRDGTFSTERLMVKHDNEYRAPQGGEDADMEKLIKSLQVDDDV
jgi:cytochrome c-type biogenesis protein CcmE